MKGNQSPLKKWRLPGMGHRKNKSLEYIVVPESKEVLKETGNLVWKLTGEHAKHRAGFKNAHIGKIWKNSSIKMVLLDYVRLNKRGI